MNQTNKYLAGILCLGLIINYAQQKLNFIVGDPEVSGQALEVWSN